MNNFYNSNNQSLPEHAQDNGNNHLWFLRDSTGWAVEFHELGHAQHISRFPGKGEAIVNFPYVYIRNVKCGDDLDTAFKSLLSHSNYTVDCAAVHWMITENFRNGNSMDKSNTTLEEFRYQHRGYAKYADIARLFGWQALKNFFYQENLDFNTKTPTCFNEHCLFSNSDGLNFVDMRILQLSKAADVDLTPLIHFWGVHPDNSTVLGQEITAAGLSFSNIVSDKLVYYACIATSNNAEFNTYFETVFQIAMLMTAQARNMDVVGIIPGLINLMKVMIPKSISQS